MEDDNIFFRDFVFGVASFASQTYSTGHNRKCFVGACIVDENNNIAAIGRNHRSYDVEDDVITEANKFHAEIEAIIVAKQKGTDLTKCKMFVTLSPCDVCVKAVTKYGIKECYYLHEYRDSKMIFNNPIFQKHTIKPKFVGPVQEENNNALDRISQLFSFYYNKRYECYFDDNEVITVKGPTSECSLINSQNIQLVINFAKEVFIPSARPE